MSSTWSSRYKAHVLAAYLRGHLLGASGGIRLAEHLAADPWSLGRLDGLPGELREEISFTKRWTQSLSGFRESWLGLNLASTAAVSAVLKPFSPARGTIRRALSLETMRSLVLAKKAMWEMGLALYPEDSDLWRELSFHDDQALSQAALLHQLHCQAVSEAYSQKAQTSLD